MVIVHQVWVGGGGWLIPGRTGSSWTCKVPMHLYCCLAAGEHSTDAPRLLLRSTNGSIDIMINVHKSVGAPVDSTAIKWL